MTRDWLLTLLALSWPFLLGATIVVLALIRRTAQNERDRRAATTPPPRDGAGQLEDVTATIPLGPDAP